ETPFYRPPDDSAEMKYLRERRQALGGYVPNRPTVHPRDETPAWDDFRKLIERDYGKEMSTTMGLVRVLERLCKDKQIGRKIVPIVPDESRTFGMEAMFRPLGIYAHAGQLYEPVDSDQFLYYKEARDGQILEEGITEAGSMASFIAAGTAYSQHGINMIPFFIYYSMFGFQRIGDMIWAANDCRAKGFLIGATAGRTTLNGEGLQHQDGHSHLNAIAFPSVRAYDPAFHYETGYIVLDGLRRLYQEGETAIYYITVHNESYEMPVMPEGAAEGIVRGMYRFRSREVDGSAPAGPRVQLFGSGAILRCVLEAQELLAEKYQVASDVWSVTSYTQLRRDAHTCRRWNMLNPSEPPRQSFVEKSLEGVNGPFVSASDNVRAVAEQLMPFVRGDYFVLGTDGVGRSDTREALRRHFEVDAACITVAALYRLSLAGQVPGQVVTQAIRDFDIHPDKVDPLFA
ncbi:MAG: pyruvate dehydrogenase (acetyl-transferring), homodimeric type, partial [Pirellulaceae bacterium]